MAPAMSEKKPGSIDVLRYVLRGTLLAVVLPAFFIYSYFQNVDRHRQFQKDGVVLEGVVERSRPVTTRGRRSSTTTFEITVRCPTPQPSVHVVSSVTDIQARTPVKIRYSPTLEASVFEEAFTAAEESTDVASSDRFKASDIGPYIAMGFFAIGVWQFSIAYRMFSRKR
jgi:hypothetical protein